MPGWSRDKRIAFEKAFYVYLNACFINSKDSGHICLGENLYEGQRKLLTEIFDGLEADIHKFYILKSRQLGITTITRALMIFYIGVHKGLKGALVFDTAPNREEARAELVTMIKDLPAKLKFPKIKGTGEGNREGVTLMNDSKILFKNAGVKKSKSSGTLGRSVGLTVAHLSELCSFDNDEGLESFEQSLSDTHPDRLYIYESTARGFNRWWEIWHEARKDPAHCKCIFLGWFTKDSQQIERDAADFALYGNTAPTTKEKEKINLVAERYKHTITVEQLAWIRRKMDPSATAEGDADPEFEGNVTRIQEQPWCVTAETRVGTARGILKIADLKEGDVTARGLVLKAGPTGAAEVWKVRTKLGYELRGTANHPLINVDGQEVRIDSALHQRVKLQPPRFAKDVFVLHWKEGVTNMSITVTPDLARFVGLFMGDGSASSGHGRYIASREVKIVCCNEDMDIVAECSRLFSDLFGCVPSVSSEKIGKGWTDVRSGKALVLDTIRKLGLLRNDIGKTMRKVHVPEFIWQSPKYVVKEFLSGLFEADGFNAYETNRVALFSKYPEFIADIQKLLLAFGITSRAVSMRKKADDTHFYTGHQLELRTAEALKFNAEIGFISKRKRDRYDPVAYEKMWADAVRLKKRGNRKRPEIVLEDEIASVENEGGVETVYNLTVEGEHLFDANGILTHNTEEEAFQQTGSVFFTSENLTEITRSYVSPKFQTFTYFAGAEFFDMRIDKAPNSKMIDLKVWEEPDPEGVYVLGCDPAFGENELNDRSSIQVLRCYADGLDQVAEYASPLVNTRQLAWVIASLLGWYGQGNANVRYALELNGPGGAVFNELRSLKHQLETGYHRQQLEERGLRDIFRNVRTYIYSRADAIGQGSNYHIKCLAVDTDIPTVSGWKKLEDVFPGDVLFDDKGNRCTVLRVSEIKSNHDCYRVSFDDGTSLVADNAHLWEVRGGREAYDKGPELITTDKLISGRHTINVAEPLNLSSADLPIDPYVLGVWLGDGNSESAIFYSHESDIAEMSGYIAEGGFSLGEVKPDKTVQRRLISGLYAKLRVSNLLKNKHIPEIYLRASFPQRLALLQGLMDTDGTVNVSNGRQCLFSTSNPDLVSGFSELLRSLGVKSKYHVLNPTLLYKGRQVSCAPAFQFFFTAYPDLSVFRLKRKLQKTKGGANFRPRVSKRHKIISVEPVSSVPVKCIEVDSPSHLFLAGRAMVPTHNTNTQLKITFLERMRDFVSSAKFRIRSMELVEEMKTIARDGDSIKAPGSMKDDRVLAASFAVHCWETGPLKMLQTQNKTRQLEQARQRTTIADQVALFQQNHLNRFFEQKRQVRLVAQRQATKFAWRGR